MPHRLDEVSVIDSRTLYDGHSRRVVEDVVKFADGSADRWVYIRCSDAVAIAALTEDNKMILTRQYRHPFRKVIYDMPAGAVEKGETFKQAALRELEEETGYTAEKLEWIGRFTWAPASMGPGTVEIFFTKSVRTKTNFDPNEITSVELMAFDNVLEKVLKGEYIDSALVTATLLIAAKRLLDS